MDEKILAGLEEAGFVSFGFATTGFAVIMSNEPVHSLVDLKGKRVWVPEGDGISKASMLALSVSPVNCSAALFNFSASASKSVTATPKTFKSCRVSSITCAPYVWR